MSNGALHRLIVRVLCGALLLLVAACGGSPTQEEEAAAPVPSDGTPADDAGAQDSVEDPYAEVFAALEGLEGQERTDRLVELAEAEGALNVYTSNTDLADQAEVFTETYGIEVSVYRAQANQVLQRLLQEDQAGYAGADLVDSNAEELATANSEGLLRDYEGPATEGLVEASLQEGWVGTRLNVFTVAWNRDAVPEAPTSLEDVADERFSGLVMMEPRAFEWYMALSQYYTEQGMDQDEVDQIFSDVAANSVLVTGNTTHAQFLASGEYGVSTSVYNHLVDELTDTGAPVVREPVVEPLVVRPNGAGLLRTAENPASALLLLEWLLGDAQELLIEDFRVPARIEYQQGDLEGVEIVSVDVTMLVDEGAEWEARYEELLRNAQGTVEGE